MHICTCVKKPSCNQSTRSAACELADTIAQCMQCSDLLIRVDDYIHSTTILAKLQRLQMLTTSPRIVSSLTCVSSPSDFEQGGWTAAAKCGLEKGEGSEYQPDALVVVVCTCGWVSFCGESLWDCCWGRKVAAMLLKKYWK